MPYQLSQNESKLEIEITDVGDHASELLASFQACQEGRCSCPTNEYEKLADLAVDVADGAIHLRLTPVTGTQFDSSEIAKCLDFTLAQSQA
ncbi:MAG: hypothetical protein KBG20_02930 [Caldilineaceae bacterium]|nr:hypothetical protein [Caldilineaceae bacterium]MBP8110633.1 hypothetical protein [Caldilineaceae bacterium]MBP8124335.1 hypothetical protein [Caldilineaceae bacterium]MBP9071219.1 hypothetical protein [Caldilineaceae bacterium]